jgi:hypothetical protein
VHNILAIIIEFPELFPKYESADQVPIKHAHEPVQKGVADGLAMLL